jgi:small subunit ribosomal protein S17
MAEDEKTKKDDETAESAAAEETQAASAPEGPVAPAPGAGEDQPEQGPRSKKKRLPRSQRRVRTKPKREQTGGRKPITRLPKPEAERGRRQERRGVVVSNAMDKTIVVKVDTIKAHRKYQKVVRRSQKFHAHDEGNSANVGDVVRIVETRPLSKSKHWRLVEIVEAAR